MSDSTSQILLNKHNRKPRNSNLELYRIIVMLLIIAHHYVVSSGLMKVIFDNPTTPSSIIMLLFGAWGKTGINCFVLISGYFLCKSEYTLKKLLKLYLQISFYAVFIYAIFLIFGQENLSIKRIGSLFIPISDLTPNNFVGCFLVFYLLIPFINIFLNSLDQKQHFLLMMILVTAYSILPSLGISLPINYIGWFSIIYIIAAYIRLYGFPVILSHKTWGWLTIISILISALSIIGMVMLVKIGITLTPTSPYLFVSDSNKILALITSICSFMFFKDLKIPHSRIINILGGATFGILLIHSNSDAMRHWLWKETVDCVGHFSEELVWTICYASATVILIFIICAGIDWFRSSYIENYLQHKSEKILYKSWSKIKSNFEKRF